jgi:co-chaperonin GroES (HSP10)
MRPLGARIFVRDVVTTLSIEARAEAAGFIAIVNDENKPRPTEGVVLAIGNDPLIQEFCKVGDTVVFDWHAGRRIYEGGEEYRALDLPELLGVRSNEKEGL